MGTDSQPIKLTASGTTSIGSSLLMAICINKTLTGTLTVNEGATAMGQFAIGTAVGTYHIVPNGGRYANLNFVLSAGDDVTIYFKRA